jgi:hypothetical protein
MRGDSSEVEQAATRTGGYVHVLSGALVYLMMPVFGIGMRILSYSVEKAATIYCTDALSYYSY